MRGIRIQNIVKELHDEKIDVIEWNPNAEMFISKALSPARVSGVYLEDDPDSGRTAIVIVPDDQLSLAIGREGQNARLAAKLTGWRIDIKSVSEAVQEALDTLDSPALRDVGENQPEVIADVNRIMEKRAANRAVMPEEFTLLGKFADMVQRRQMAAREQKRQERLAEINAVRMTLPQGAFQMPVESLDLSEDYLEALAPLGNVGEIMLRFLIDESRLQRLLSDLPVDAMKQIQTALDKLVIPEFVEEPAAEETEVEEAAEAAAENLVEEGAEAVAPDVFADLPEAVDAPAAKPAAQPEAVGEAFVEEEDEDVDDLLGKQGKGDKKKKKKGRDLIFDEKVGGMVVKRRRKGSRGRGDDWNNWEE
jgi:N utilization substance protein A